MSYFFFFLTSKAVPVVASDHHQLEIKDLKEKDSEISRLKRELVEQQLLKVSSQPSSMREGAGGGRSSEHVLEGHHTAEKEMIKRLPREDIGFSRLAEAEKTAVARAENARRFDAESATEPEATAAAIVKSKAEMVFQHEIDRLQSELGIADN